MSTKMSCFVSASVAYSSNDRSKKSSQLPIFDIRLDNPGQAIKVIIGLSLMKSSQAK
jgi:hypothetical protein